MPATTAATQNTTAHTSPAAPTRVLEPIDLTPKNPLLTPHLFAGFVPSVGLTVILSPPLLGSHDLASSLATATRHGRDLFFPYSHDPDRLVQPPASSPIHFRENTSARHHPVLFATHHPDRAESFFNRHPNATIPPAPGMPVESAAPILFREPLEIDADPEDFIERLESDLEALDTDAQAFKTQLATRSASATAQASSGSNGVVAANATAGAQTAPAPNINAAASESASATANADFSRPIGPPLIILAPMLPARFPGGPRLSAAAAALTKSLGNFAERNRIAIIAVLDCGTSPRSFAAALSAAMTLPGVASIISLTADPQDAANRTLTAHIVRGVRSVPLTLSALLMEPRLDLGPAEVDPHALAITPDAPVHRARHHAVVWLKDYLTLRRGEPRVADILKAAEAEGISRATIYRARHVLRIETAPGETARTGFTWNLPKDTTDTYTHRYVNDSFANHEQAAANARKERAQTEKAEHEKAARAQTQSATPQRTHHPTHAITKPQPLLPALPSPQPTTSPTTQPTAQATTTAAPVTLTISATKPPPAQPPSQASSQISSQISPPTPAPIATAPAASNPLSPHQRDDQPNAPHADQSDYTVDNFTDDTPGDTPNDALTDPFNRSSQPVSQSRSHVPSQSQISPPTHHPKPRTTTPRPLVAA